MGCLCQIPALSAQGSRQKRKQKYFNKQRWYTTLRKQCLPNITGQRHYMWVYITHINCKSIHKTCVGLRDGGLPLRGGSDTMPIPNQEIIFNWCQLIKGKKVFFSGFSLDVLKCSGVVSQYKTNSMIFYVLSFCLDFHSVVSFGILCGSLDRTFLLYKMFK